MIQNYHIFSVLLIIAILALGAIAIDKQDIKLLAEHYGQMNVDACIPIHSGTDTSTWIVNFESGYMIFSNQKEIQPLLAYSNRGKLDQTSSYYQQFLSFIRKDIKNRNKQMQVSPDKEMISENIELWNDLLSSEKSNLSSTLAFCLSPFALSSAKGDSQTYFLNTPEWGQGNVNGEQLFNIYTPNHWSVGCVATAMAEVLAYYQWPEVGEGSHYYTEDDAGGLMVDFGTSSYYLDNTVHNYKNETSNLTQKYNAAKVSYHAAVSLNMNFESTGSSANTYNVDNSLRNYFRYSADYRSASSELFDLLENDIKNGNPGIIALDGTVDHAVVVDGYSDSDGFFHLNMGWNGDYNAWYDIRGSFNASAYGDALVIGGVHSILPIKVIADPVVIQFHINFTERILDTNESVLLFGNIPPLGSIQNSPDFQKNGSEYVTTLEFDNIYVGDTLSYRFGILKENGYEYEIENRVIGLETNENLQHVYHDYNNFYTDIDNFTNSDEILTRIQSYPNPFNNTLTIDLNNLIPGQDYSINI
ncbi:MAG: C10 family peptidase, partial [Candidatus Marinimicrobia bacterium]|nr:C10 family peptidase [Candidatus Neomarinimicrobiota bacterium]